MIAVTATAIGFAFDAGGGRDLTHVFAALYMSGCIAAVLLVRRSGIFTAVVQPPMILFVGVPGAYFLFHGAKLTGLKDIVINCLYPLIERFPLMVFTSGAVLLIGYLCRKIGKSTADLAARRSSRLPLKYFSIRWAMISVSVSVTNLWPCAINSRLRAR